MNNIFFNMIYCEFLKTRRTAAIWLVLAGGFFSPLIVIMSRLLIRNKLPAIYSAESFWPNLWKNTWEVVAVMLLPIGIILLASQLAQIEFKNNTWKQVHTLPVSAAAVYFSKLIVVFVFLSVFFLVVNLGVFVAAAVPAYFAIEQLSIPQSIPYKTFLLDSFRYFIACAPIVTLQHALSMHFKNFITPLGIGVTIWVATITAVSWKWVFISPFSLPVLSYLADDVQSKASELPVNLPIFSITYMLFFALSGFLFFVKKPEKG